MSNESDQTKIDREWPDSVTELELATLAARTDPQAAASDPFKAISQAVRLLDQAEKWLLELEDQ